jgi:hypothetical protein
MMLDGGQILSSGANFGGTQSRKEICTRLAAIHKDNSVKIMVLH